MTNAIGAAKQFELKRIMKATNTVRRRIEHADQVLNARITRAMSEYKASVQRAVMDEEDPPQHEAEQEAAAV